MPGKKKKGRPKIPTVPAAMEVAGLAGRKRFIGLKQQDLRLLAGLREVFAPHLDRIVDGFYDHLLAFEPLNALLGDAETVERLKVFQRQYLQSLTEGELGESYLEDRLRIGRTHERIGLTPQWFLGAFAFHQEHLIPLVLEHFRNRPEQATRATVALQKLINLDVQIVLDAYFTVSQQKALERSQQLAAVGELAASIAHEVRNPLASMKGAMDVLRKDLALDPSKIEVADELVAQIVRLEELVRDLLTYARPRPLDRRSVDLHGLLDRVLRQTQERSDASHIQVETDYQSATKEFNADAQQLEQVFLNLIQNAVLAMEEGGKLTVSTQTEDGSFQIVFQDNGKGIPSADLPRIFKPFFTTRHRGSGLGLAIVQKILEAHGGAIRLESEVGEGTTAVVTLPGGE